ncbi:MAG: glycosyltransferase family 2 protein [Polyangiales bacterium]
MSLKSIIVPCFDEAESLPRLLSDFEAITEGQPVDWELVLVDNGSTDATPQVLARELKLPGRAFARVVTVPPPNVGYGHGIMTGLEAANGDYLAWTHADGQTPPADVLRAFETLLSAPAPKRTFVKGRRRARQLKDVLFTLGMRATSAVVLGEPLHDFDGQPTAFHRDLLTLAAAPPVDLSIDLYFSWVAKTHGFDVRTIDVSRAEREEGEAKRARDWRSKARDLARTVRFMKAVRSGADYRAFRA